MPRTSTSARRSTRSRRRRRCSKCWARSRKPSFDLSAVSQHPNRFRAVPTTHIGGRITVAGDKSISHRALMLGAIAEGTTVVHGFLASEDCLATQACSRGHGRRHRTQRRKASCESKASGARGLRAPTKVLDLGNSGTGIRLLMGLLAGQPFDSELTGDASLRQRPMERVAAPLGSMGARIDDIERRPAARSPSAAARACAVSTTRCRWRARR